MVDRHDGTGQGGQRHDQTVPGTETVEAYEVDGGVVLHDAENPLAWVEAEASRAIELAEYA